jgi:hypothetical protein
VSINLKYANESGNENTNTMDVFGEQPLTRAHASWKCHEELKRNKVLPRPSATMWRAIPPQRIKGGTETLFLKIFQSEKYF